ncbi:hypothetical protein LPJ53_000315 [Coemansia erecta]|uniref:Nucleolar 27S pre-rRNA processing Urb2/Npa2 C-terminal domain-containing protein n=1 Tax=Coemansia erecta TaxID=147472 RepID=A0A9W8CTA6_9FUNG|nr:hypothetical protein LPJ53_000315 [Coemansia erecta]
MSTAEQQTVAQLVAASGLRTAEDVLRTLSQGKQPLAHRISLARLVFDAPPASSPALAQLSQIGATLVRKNERLADWLFGVMLRELKDSKKDAAAAAAAAAEYRAYRDSRALALLGDMLERMCAAGAVEVRVVFRGLAMALFEGALRSGPLRDEGYVAQVGRLWALVVERTADGMEDAVAHGDQVARVLGLAIERYFAAPPAAQARETLLGLALSSAAVVRGLCETSGARRTLALVADHLLAQLLRLAGSLAGTQQQQQQQRQEVLDTLWAAAFPAEATVQLAMLLADSAARDQRPDANAHMAERVLATAARCMSADDPQELAHCAGALPDLLAGFLRALARVCPAALGRRSLPGVPPVAPGDAGRAALAMFQRLRALLAQNEPAAAAGLGPAGARLAQVYFADAWFGSVGSADVGGVRAAQMDELARWLAADVLPALRRASGADADADADSAQLARAFDAARLAVDAGGPQALAPLGAQLYASLAHAPAGHPAAYRLLTHLAATTARMRTLDEFIFELAQAHPCPRAADNLLLLSADFQHVLAATVARHMPFAQAARVLGRLAGMLEETEGDAGREARGAKRRRLGAGMKGRAELLAVVMAGFAPAGAAAAATDQQRVLYAAALQAAYARAQAFFARAPRSVRWAWPLLHHTLAAVVLRTGGGGGAASSAAWLAAVLNPQHVQTHVLRAAKKASDDDGVVDPRVPPLDMLVALQSAAHWAAEGGGARAEVERMVGRALGCIAGTAGWAPWDGRAAGITRDNRSAAAWRLLAARLPLACEFADAPALHRLADVLAARLFAGDHGVLADAGLFEIAGLRPALLPAMVRHACALADHAALAMLAEGEGMGAEAIAVLVADGLAPPPLREELAAPWALAVRALLRFPPAYWPADQLPAVLALALFADRACTDAPEPRQLLARLLARRQPQAAHLLAPHVQQLLQQLQRQPTSSASAEHARATRHLVHALAAALLQAGMQGTGDAAQEADTACRSLCIRLLDTDGVLALEALAAVARVAALGPRALRRNCPAPGKWLEWASACVGKCRGVDNIADADADTVVVCCGVRACVRALRRSLADMDEDEDADADADGDNDASHATDDVLALALTLDSVHKPGALAAPQAAQLLSQLAGHLHRALAQSSAHIAPLLQAFSGCVAPHLSTSSFSFSSQASDSQAGFIALHAAFLLQRMDAGHFDRTLVRLVQLAAQPGASHATPRLLRACLLAGRPGLGVGARNDSQEKKYNGGEEKRRSVQRRVGAIISALHVALRTPDAQEALDALADLVQDAKVRLAPHDTAAALALATTACMLPGRPPRPADLYISVCRLLGALAIHHASGVLACLPTYVAALRTLLHAFATPAKEKEEEKEEEAATHMATAAFVDTAPWITACAPLPVECAEAYARALSALARARRQEPHKNGGEPHGHGHGHGHSGHSGNRMVSLARGTRAAGMASALSPFVTQVLAEYCVIQAAGARSVAVPRPAPRHQGGETHVHGQAEFSGFAWRPVPVAAELPMPLSLQNPMKRAPMGIIASPALRDALLPGWYALLDVIQEADRAALLALLATDTRGAPVFGGSSIFGPDSYGGANEILKALYQSYLDFYKYKGNV